jgi:hypothetical protein
MSTPMIDPPCPSSDRRYVVEAGNSDPVAQHQHERDDLIDRGLHATRAAANQAARSFLQRGLWVEVYDDDTKELLAGPFDPDQAAPAYIV